MDFKRVSKPKTGMVRDGNSVMLRFLTGKRQGQPVPTRPNSVREIVCARCTLPSYRGLPPFVKALGFDKKTGAAIEQFVHERCPRNIAKNKAMILQFAEEAKKRAQELAKLPRHRLPFKTLRGMFR